MARSTTKRSSATSSSKTATSRPKAASKDESRSGPASESKSRTGRKKAASSAIGARPLWTGNLRLSLVSVPVRLYPATRTGARISFHQVHEPSGKRIRYEKVVPGLGPVDTDEIVKGFEIEKGRYVLIDEDEIDAVKIEARKTLDMVQFVSQGEIDPIWFDRPYYVVPEDDLAEEAYGILREALRQSKRIGLGQFVMRGREYVAAIKPCGRGLLLETLRFSDEVRTAAPFFADVDDDKADPELLSLAKDLIDRKTSPFEPERFEDHYTTALRELIEHKAKDGKPLEISEDGPQETGKVIDLVEALRRSVQAAQGAKAKPEQKTSPRPSRKAS